MTETTHVFTHRLAKPREERRIYHTLSPAGMAKRRWDTRYSAYERLYADYLFLIVLVLFYGYGELKPDLTERKGGFVELHGAVRRNYGSHARGIEQVKEKGKEKEGKERKKERGKQSGIWHGASK